MCGITGFLCQDRSRVIDPARMQQMTDCVAHRGPDGEGWFHEDGVGLGHRRLSIIDLATGDQPMFNDDRT
ncbi:MAG TPA: asparagine synthetase B, partial [bacterium]|nr:asparagine synthetase B [bacterium]